MTSKEKGNISLGRAIHYFTQKGYTVLLPLNDAQDYDLAVDNGERLFTIQIKYTTQKASSGFYVAKLYVCGHTDANGKSYKKIPNYNKIDYYWFSNDINENWLIPTKDIEHLGTVTLNNTKDKYKLVV